MLVRSDTRRQEADMTSDPHSLFEEWFALARTSEPNDPDAMALATADAAGRPSVRMVLLKAHDPRGFVFYTNQDSRKGGELEANAQAALLFHWKSLRRQVRVEGRVEPVNAEEADAYFASRLGVGAIPPARPPRNLRSAPRGNAPPLRRRSGAAPAALVRLPSHPRPHRVLERPRPPPP
jgi:pyridoxine/pyridoxamine 5'-phosphate oxidase